MSEYLSLLVLDEGNSPVPEIGLVVPHTKLEMGQDYGVMGQIIDLSWIREGSPHRTDIPTAPHIATQPLPRDVEVYATSHSGGKFTRTDDTGEEMHWALARDLATIEVTDEHAAVSTINRAVKAYLGALSGGNAVVLFRH